MQHTLNPDRGSDLLVARIKPGCCGCLDKAPFRSYQRNRILRMAVEIRGVMAYRCSVFGAQVYQHSVFGTPVPATHRLNLWYVRG